MKILFAFGWIPAPVFYVKWLFADGFSPCVCIFIKEAFRNDVGLHQHELTHIEQAYRLALIPHGILYLLSKRYRQWAEVEAYKVSISYGMSPERAAQLLATEYRLGLSESAALLLFTNV